MKQQTFSSSNIVRTAARVLLVLVIVVICNIAAPLPVSADTIYKSGTISSDETWTSNNVYVISGDLAIASGATVTIQAGTVVKFVNGRQMTVSGVLDLQGTEASPVVFTSLQDDTYGGDTNEDGIATWPAPGSWEWIVFTGTHPDTTNTFDYAIVRYGGRYLNGYNPMLWASGSVSLTVQNSVFEHSGGYGIQYDSVSGPLWIEGNTISNFNYGGIYVSGCDSITVRNNTITGQGSGIGVLVSTSSNTTVSLNDISNTLYAISVQHSSPDLTSNTLTGNDYPFNLVGAVSPTYISNTVTGNTHQGIRVEGPLGNATWYNIGLPYIIPGDVSIAADATLGIAAGTVVKFVNGRQMTVSGVLDLQGTEASPVVFTSLQDDTYGGDTNGDGIATWPAPGSWEWIVFTGTHPDTTNTFDYAIVRYGGRHLNGYNPMLWIGNGTQVTVRYCLFEYSGGHGITIEHGSTDPDVTVEYCTFCNNSHSGITVVP